jgi:GTP-binding protein
VAGDEAASVHDTDDLDLEAGRHLFAQPVRFMLGVAKLNQLPEDDLPEIAFAGRSNVGKSSLINALLNRNDMARTSNTPGRTQQLNFFDLAGRLCLVDLPGYGFAKAPKKLVEAWTRLVFAYLRGRQSLKVVVLLIDARHGLKPNDEEAMTLLGEAAVPFQVVLTKADLIGPQARTQLLADIAQALSRRKAALPMAVTTSARKGAGIEQLRAILASYAKPLE